MGIYSRIPTPEDREIKWINSNIKSLEDTNKVSDGYHTFGELYEHRIRLYIALCKALKNDYDVWFSKLHHDGSSFDGWLIVGMNSEDPKFQITYHVDESKHRQLLEAAGIPEVDKAPIEFDGHTSDDILKRLEEYLIRK